MAFNDSPPDPDYSDLPWCSDCRSPVFDGPATGCECRDYCAGGCDELVSRDALGPLTLASGKVVQACAGCRAAAESDGVPEAVGEEKTVRETMSMEDVADYWAAARLTGDARKAAAL